jgi:hypothetical protein
LPNDELFDAVQRAALLYPFPQVEAQGSKGDGQKFELLAR